MAEQGIDAVATIVPEPARGDLSATEASMVWRHALEGGRYDYTSPGSNGNVAYTVLIEGGRIVLRVFGETRDAADVDADMLAIIAGVTFSYDETETGSANCAAAYVAAYPGVAS